MKKISKKQSRRNIKKRKSKVAARHAKAGSWSNQSRPVFGSGTIHYEVGSNTDAMSYGGIAPVHQLATKLGLRDQIDADLKLLKRHLPYHESDHILNMAYNVLCGGTRLEDIERLRHDVAYMNALGLDLITDPTTAGDFTRRFSEEDVETLMEAYPLENGDQAEMPCYNSFSINNADFLVTDAWSMQAVRIEEVTQNDATIHSATLAFMRVTPSDT